MKRKVSLKLLFVVLAMGLMTFFTSCKTEEVVPEPQTGELVVKVQLEGSTGYLQGASVGLATSQQNLDNSIYLQDLVTNENGEANFGELNPDNYYFDAFIEISDVEYYGEGQVQVVAGQSLELTLVIE